MPTTSHTIKNILIIAQDIFPDSGWGRYTRDLCTFLKNNNIEVYVACQKKNYTEHSINQITGLPSPNAFKKNYLLSWLYAYSVYRKLSKELKQSKVTPDIIHCTVEPYVLIAFFLSTLLKIPYVVTAHGSFAVRPFSFPWLKKFHAYALSRAHTIVCISSYTKQRLLTYLPVIKNSTQIIPNGVHPKMILDKIVLTKIMHTKILTERTIESSNKNREKKPIKPVLLGIGALKERKGYLYVIKALPHIIAVIPNVQYVIVGDQSDGEYVKKLKDLVKELSVERHVTFFEHISEEQLNAQYAEATIFVLTPVSSEFSFEGFGLVYLEANAHGVPVIGSYGNGGEDAIVHGKTGFLTQPEDTDDIAQKIIALLNAPAVDYRDYSTQALAWAESLSWEHIIKNYIVVYTQCLLSEPR